MINTSEDVQARRKIWVICEGKHEQEGALLHLIQRIMPGAENCDYEFDSWKSPRAGRRKFRTNNKGDGIFKKFIAMLFDAQQIGFDAVIAVIDCDCDRGRINSVNAAQDEPTVLFPRAFGVAVETFDSWFLSDEAALSKVFNTTIDRQSNPESNRDSKVAMRLLRNQSGLSLGLSECYSKLAETADIALIGKRCPKGFAVWKDRVAKL